MRAVATAGRSPVGVRGALLLALIGCGGTAEPCTGGDTCELEGQVQVATWWGTRGELYVPFEVLTQSLRRSTGLEAKLAHKLQTKGEHTAWVEEQLDEETLSPKPLDVFSANNGDEVLRWTPCAASGAPPASPKLLGLTNPQLGLSALDPGWIQDNFRPEVMRTLECYGETYALPVGIHRINTLFFNKALFRAAGYAVDGGAGEPLPSSLDELHTAAAALSEHLPPAAAGSLVPPSVFAVAGREAWTLSLFVIENLMLSLAADAAHYERYWTGEACDEDLLRRTLEEFLRLKDWFGNWELSPSEALARVANGQAATMVMGNWAAAELAPEAVGMMPFPGTDQYFVFSADVFALPAIPSGDPQKGLAWLRAVTGDVTQRAFSVAKSALPARLDLEADLDPTPSSSLRWVRSLPAILPYHPDSPFLLLQNELQSWLASGEPTGEPLLRFARNEYLKLSHGRVSCDRSAVDTDVPK